MSIRWETGIIPEFCVLSCQSIVKQNFGTMRFIGNESANDEGYSRSSSPIEEFDYIERSRSLFTKAGKRSPDPTTVLGRSLYPPLQEIIRIPELIPLFSGYRGRDRPSCNQGLFAHVSQPHKNECEMSQALLDSTLEFKYLHSVISPVICGCRK